MAEDLVVNDVHSRLNLTRVSSLLAPTDADALVRAIRMTESPLSICGARHAMGGQQFGADQALIDMRSLDRVLAFDRANGYLEVQAGTQWPKVIAFLVQHAAADGSGWGIVQKQTGADELTLGGALSANVHGRGLKLKPLVGDIERFTLIDAHGQIQTCSRTENAELFRLAIGGYGLFGVIYSVGLRLALRTKVRRRVRVQSSSTLADAFNVHIGEGCTYGDFQFVTDEQSVDFLSKGILACYEPVPENAVIPERQDELSVEQWERLYELAHTDKRGAFEAYSRHYLSTDGQVYWSDIAQTSVYLRDFPTEMNRRLGRTASLMITEVYVPRSSLDGFMQAAAAVLRNVGADLIYGVVRLIEADSETFLAWAREDFACIVFNLQVDHSATGIRAAQAQFTALIDCALTMGGSYYLTYHRWARRDQVVACYPQMEEFLARKLEADPDERFQSDWYRHMKTLMNAGSSLEH